MRTSMLILSLLFIAHIPSSFSLNKYSKEANQPEAVQESKDALNKDSEENPFRLAKINLIWAKAKKVVNIFQYSKKLNNSFVVL